MEYTVLEEKDAVIITGDWGLLSARLCRITSFRARDIIGRELMEWEDCYWLTKISNKSGRKWEGTNLLRFVIDFFEKKNTTLWLIAAPDMYVWDVKPITTMTEERLENWYKRHWFKEAGSKSHVLVYEPIR